MHPHARLIETFYICFQHREGDGMAACYHREVRSSDPVFPDLRGERAGAMWRMLTARATELEISFSDVRADDERGTAHWEAIYLFSATGRRVHNRIDAAFEFRDGKIIRHRDQFELWRWAGMALGPAGLLFGWLPPMRAAIRRKAARSLERYLAEQGR